MSRDELVSQCHVNSVIYLYLMSVSTLLIYLDPSFKICATISYPGPLLPHSGIGHYIYSNLYGCAPCGWKLTKIWYTQINLLSSYLRLDQNWRNFKKPSKLIFCFLVACFLMVFQIFVNLNLSLPNLPWACLVDNGTSFDTPGVPGSENTFIGFGLKKMLYCHV